LRFTRADWANVLFVDETRIKLRSSDGRKRVYHRRGERHSTACVEEVDRFGGGGRIMVWAGVSMHTKTPIIRVIGGLTARRYQDNITGPVLVPHFRANRGMILAQDNAPCHSARTTQQFLAGNNIRTLDWPAKSPDLNPIEHIWDLVKRNAKTLPLPATLTNWKELCYRYGSRYVRPPFKDTFCP
jgi:transposase